MSEEQDELSPKAVMRQLNKVASYTEDTRKMIREVESLVNNLTVQLQQAQAEIAMLKSQTNAALSMRGHGATT